MCTHWTIWDSHYARCVVTSPINMRLSCMTVRVKQPVLLHFINLATRLELSTKLIYQRGFIHTLHNHTMQAAVSMCGQSSHKQNNLCEQVIQGQKDALQRRHMHFQQYRQNMWLPVVSKAKNPPGCNMCKAPWQISVRLSRPIP